MSSDSTGKTNRGFIFHFLTLTGSVGRHIQALLELAGMEGREALALYLRLAIMLGAAVVFFFFGYLLLLLFLAFLCAVVFGFSWLWISLGFGIVHFLLGYICASHVRRHLRSPIFELTRAELARDFRALKSQNPSEK